MGEHWNAPPTRAESLTPGNKQVRVRARQPLTLRRPGSPTAKPDATSRLTCFANPPLRLVLLLLTARTAGIYGLRSSVCGYAGH